MVTDNEEIWRELFTGGNALLDKGRAVFGAIPSDPRCMFCHSPFEGPGGRVMRIVGRGRSREDPRFCNACIRHGQEHPGGAHVDLAMLFADMRGSTATAEQLGDRVFTELIDRFFRASSDVLIGEGALLGRLAGDAASGFFVPGVAGSDYPGAALRSALELHRVTGHASPDGPWIPLGIGIHAGHGYLGLVGAPGGAMELTALGDDINVGARLADAAAAGEVLASARLCGLVGVDTEGLEHRELHLKGKEAAVEVVVLAAP